MLPSLGHFWSRDWFTKLDALGGACVHITFFILNASVFFPIAPNEQRAYCMWQHAAKKASIIFLQSALPFCAATLSTLIVFELFRKFLVSLCLLHFRQTILYIRVQLVTLVKKKIENLVMTISVYPELYQTLTFLCNHAFVNIILSYLPSQHFAVRKNTMWTQPLKV